VNDLFRVKEEREKKGMTQEELAKKAGVSRTIISGLESGTINVTTTKTLKKIAEALGKNVSDIFLN
jgi:transcriptional regulator with XRE-family HTH domain